MEELLKIYPDGRRYLINCRTGEKRYLSEEAARRLEDGMAQVPEALARLEEHRRKWQEAQHVHWRWGGRST